MWKIMFSIAIISAVNILQGCDGLSMKPHKTSVTYGVADTEKDNGKDSIKESLDLKINTIVEARIKQLNIVTTDDFAELRRQVDELQIALNKNMHDQVG